MPCHLQSKQVILYYVRYYRINVKSKTRRAQNLRARIWHGAPRSAPCCRQTDLLTQRNIKTVSSLYISYAFETLRPLRVFHRCVLYSNFYIRPSQSQLSFSFFHIFIQSFLKSISVSNVVRIIWNRFSVFSKPMNFTLFFKFHGLKSQYALAHRNNQAGLFLSKALYGRQSFCFSAHNHEIYSSTHGSKCFFKNYFLN